MKRVGLFTAQTREREPLPIVAPGELLVVGDLATTVDVLTSGSCESEAVYLFCKSIIHFAADGSDATADSPPIDARGGSFIAVDRGSKISVRLMAGEESARCWVHAVK